MYPSNFQKFFCSLDFLPIFVPESVKPKIKKTMKKVLFSVAVVATMALASCGGASVCDCVKTMEEMMKEVEEAGGDEAKMKEIEEKYKDKAEACKKLGEGKSDEEKKKMAEEAKNCK